MITFQWVSLSMYTSPLLAKIQIGVPDLLLPTDNRGSLYRNVFKTIHVSNTPFMHII